MNTPKNDQKITPNFTKFDQKMVKINKSTYTNSKNHVYKKSRIRNITEL